MKAVLILSLGFILHMDADVAHNHAGHHAHDVEAVESDNDAQDSSEYLTQQSSEEGEEREKRTLNLLGGGSNNNNNNNNGGSGGGVSGGYGPPDSGYGGGGGAPVYVYQQGQGGNGNGGGLLGGLLGGGGALAALLPLGGLALLIPLGLLAIGPLIGTVFPTTTIVGRKKRDLAGMNYTQAELHTMVLQHYLDTSTMAEQVELQKDMVAKYLQCTDTSPHTPSLTGCVETLSCLVRDNTVQISDIERQIARLIVSGFTTNQYLPQHTVERIVRAGGVGQDYPGHCHKYHCRHHLLPGKYSWNQSGKKKIFRKKSSQ